METKKWITEEDYKDKYPRNFDENLISFDCGIGWKSLVDKIFDLIKDKDIKVDQLKEKFGLLRIYFSPHDYDIQKEIYTIEEESKNICEFCGSRDNVTTEGSWLKTLCKICRENKNSC